MRQLDYKGYVLLITEIPNFNSAGLVENSKLYRSSSTINGEIWVKDSVSVELLTQWFKEKIDGLKRPMTYEEVCQAWDGNLKTITYKDYKLTIFARKRWKDYKVVYLGRLLADNPYHYYKSSFESIHYDKVVQKFKRFIDEKCTDWVVSYSKEYEGYTLVVKKERHQGSPFFGTCEIHKNSTFKCISKSYREIEEKFKVRIDQVLQHKQGIKVVNSKEDRLKQLEAQIAKLQQELEKVKNEKDVLVYKGVILEYGPDPAIRNGWMVGRIKDALIETETFYAMSVGNMKYYFKTYIDNLEKSAKIYCQLMGLEYKESV